MLALQMTESYFLSCLFMGNMSPYYFKTIFRLCVKCILSFIKIGGAVSEKNCRIRQTFVVLYIGLECNVHCSLIVKVRNRSVIGMSKRLRLLQIIMHSTKSISREWPFSTSSNVNLFFFANSPTYSSTRELTLMSYSLYNGGWYFEIRTQETFSQKSNFQWTSFWRTLAVVAIVVSITKWLVNVVFKFNRKRGLKPPFENWHIFSSAVLTHATLSKINECT